MPSEGKKLGYRILKWFLLGFALVVMLAGVAAAYLRWFSPIDQKWVVQTLESRYEANVELKGFRSSLFPIIEIEGEGLVLRRKDQPNAPPMASIKKFSMGALWLGLLRRPRHFGKVRLEGLVINVPPRRSDNAATPQAKKPKRRVTPFVLDDVFADGATLNMISSNPSKPPHEFDIEKLRLRSAGVGQPMSFEAILTNPVPVGEIHSAGKFGPWNADDPSLTPVAGNYTFQHADLSTIRGLAGILSSKGQYEGVLSQITVEGTTDTPDFALGVSGNPVHLTTQFTALVDGTNGDTFLRPVKAQLQTSTIVAKGGVARTYGAHGRTILLAATVKPARLEDLLRLAVKSPKPTMTGDVTINTSIDIHPGDEDIAQRLKLNGDFTIQSARFTNKDAEEKITSLSRLGQGKRGNQEIQNVPLDMQGRFVMANGVANFSRLSFNVPGAAVQLHGKFGLVSQQLDFEGDVRLQAKVSQMTSGIKSILLKPIDPLFSHGGAGTVVPVKITGTKDKPSFDLLIGRALKGRF